VLSIIFLFAAVPVLYGLHRLGPYLESRDLIYYWHKTPSGGTAYSPFQELVQPQMRHVIEVGEQRQGESADREGGPLATVPNVPSEPAAPGEHADGAGCRAACPPRAGG
jgi:hypothetical protein